MGRHPAMAYAMTTPQASRRPGPAIVCAEGEPAPGPQLGEVVLMVWLIDRVGRSRRSAQATL